MWGSVSVFEEYLREEHSPEYIIRIANPSNWFGGFFFPSKVAFGDLAPCPVLGSGRPASDQACGLLWKAKDTGLAQWPSLMGVGLHLQPGKGVFLCKGGWATGMQPFWEGGGGGGEEEEGTLCPEPLTLTF